MDNNWTLALCCVLPGVVLIVSSVVAIQRGQRWLTPDIDSLRRDFEALQKQNPSLPVKALVQKIIHRQALRSGVIGAITSVGGLPILPFGLGLDLYTSARIQNATLYFIAWAYESDGRKDDEAALTLNEALALTPRLEGLLVQRGQIAARVASRRLMVIVVEKTFAKLIPGIGLLIGFVVNYAIARGVSQIAAEWHARIHTNSAGERTS